MHKDTPTNSPQELLKSYVVRDYEMSTVTEETLSRLLR